MIIMVEPVVKCVEEIQKLSELVGQVILMTPQGKTLDQKLIEELTIGHEGDESFDRRRFILLCGRYEGFDQRVIDILRPTEISIGDFILNGGEVAAMVMVDSLVRMVPGVLGDERSSIEDSFSRGNRWLEYPQYTRPREFRGHEVPEVLLSGDHQKIESWRKQQSLVKTRQRRSDLLEPSELEQNRKIEEDNRRS